MKTLYRSSSSDDSLIHRPYTLYPLKFLLLCPSYKDPISSYEAFHEYSVSNLEMIEPELAFADLNDDMACATAYLQYVVKHVLENCKEYMDFFKNCIEIGIIDRLSDVEKSFVRMKYTDAVELLLKSKKKFEFPVKWGCELQSEHEHYITEEDFNGCPVIITDYPKA
ncbi:putative asparagine--tRNA ligase [Helianthus annuus]|uniref:Asparagine--tRNA ligase n=2 Tax=Helianthus annuus TaxID=4232 RepID=A0A9K3HYB2_HELAN|nr:putative asparagine--tRNA ligase [Helianthus annuus]KAJ0514474.1 putative asparagine--tRNA ligase [Helianthus annuus]